MNYTIDAALAISFVIGAALQVSMFVATLVFKHQSDKALEKAKKMTEDADEMAAEAERIHNGAMMCLKMSNELFYCHTNDERANLIIRWVPKLQEAGIDMQDIDEIINNQ